MNNKNRLIYTEPSEEVREKLFTIYGNPDSGSYNFILKKLFEYTYRSEFYSKRNALGLLETLEGLFSLIPEKEGSPKKQSYYPKIRDITSNDTQMLLANVLRNYSRLGNEYDDVVLAILDLFLLNGISYSEFILMVEETKFNIDTLRALPRKAYIEIEADLNQRKQNIASSTASNEDVSENNASTNKVVSDATANDYETPPTTKNDKLVNNYLAPSTESESKVEKELPTRNTFKTRYLDAIGKKKGGSKTRNQNKKKRRSNKRRDSKKRRR